MRVATPSMEPSPDPERTWLQGFAPIAREHGFEPIEVRGALPPELEGTFYWNCPARQPGAGPDWYGHLADGDGAVVGVRLAGGRALGALRFVQTRSFRKERAAGRRLYARYLAPSPRPVREYLLGDHRHTANTHVLPIRGQLVALAETGRPVELDPDSLDTLGERALFGATGGHTAHPHRVAGRAATYAAPGVLGQRSGVELHELPDRGAPRRLAFVPLDGPTLVHDVALTPGHAIVFVSPLRFELWRVLLNLGGPGQAARWKPALGTEVVVIPLDRPGEVVRFGVEPFQTFHYVNAFEPRAGELVVDYVRHRDFHGLNDYVAALACGQSAPAPTIALHRARIDLRARTMRSERLLDNPVEFPTRAPAVAGQHYRFAYLASFRPGVHGMPDRLLKVDVEAGRRDEFALEPGWWVNEPLFVPRRDAAGEDDGWLAILVQDGKDGRGLLAIFDARTPARGPVATVRFAHALPYTFHGCWVPAAGAGTDAAPLAG